MARVLEVERRRTKTTLRDARNVARADLLPRFGADTPLYLVERHEVVVRRGGRQFVEVREERRDRFTTDDVDALRRELLASDRSPRTVQKVLVLLHGVFKLAKRRKLIANNPSEDAERVTLEDAGIFNVLEPIEFEAVYRGPLVPILAQRLAALAMRERFTGDADYVFCTAFGERVGEKRIRKVFYAALGRAGLGHRRDDADPGGNPQLPIRLHDLRHSWGTWAVNVWPLTKVQAYADHRDVKTTQRYVHHQTKAQDADLGGAYLEAALAQPTLAAG